MSLRNSKAALLTAFSLIAIPVSAAPAVTVTNPAVSDEAATKEAEKNEAAEKRICKQIATDMSSRRRTRVCKTREEWRVFDRQQRTGAN